MIAISRLIDGLPIEMQMAARKSDELIANNNYNYNKLKPIIRRSRGMALDPASCPICAVRAFAGSRSRRTLQFGPTVIGAHLSCQDDGRPFSIYDRSRSSLLSASEFRALWI